MTAQVQSSRLEPQPLADGDPRLVDKLIGRQMMGCCVCRRTQLTSYDDPKMTICHHSICKDCYHKKHAMCRFCLLNINLDNGLLANLPLLWYLAYNHKSDHVHDQGSSGKKLRCGTCSEKAEESQALDVVGYCHECEEVTEKPCLLCRQCLSYHTTFQPLAKHKPITADRQQLRALQFLFKISSELDIRYDGYCLDCHTTIKKGNTCQKGHLLCYANSRATQPESFIDVIKNYNEETAADLKKNIEDASQAKRDLSHRKLDRIGEIVAAACAQMIASKIKQTKEEIDTCEAENLSAKLQQFESRIQSNLIALDFTTATAYLCQDAPSSLDRLPLMQLYCQQTNVKMLKRDAAKTIRDLPDIDINNYVNGNNIVKALAKTLEDIEIPAQMLILPKEEHDKHTLRSDLPPNEVQKDKPPVQKSSSVVPDMTLRASPEKRDATALFDEDAPLSQVKAKKPRKDKTPSTLTSSKVTDQSPQKSKGKKKKKKKRANIEETTDWKRKKSKKRPDSSTPSKQHFKIPKKSVAAASTLSKACETMRRPSLPEADPNFIDHTPATKFSGVLEVPFTEGFEKVKIKKEWMEEICETCGLFEIPLPLVDLIRARLTKDGDDPPPAPAVERRRAAADKLNWIECESCNKWSHTACVLRKKHNEYEYVQTSKQGGEEKIVAFECIDCVKKKDRNRNLTAKTAAQ